MEQNLNPNPIQTSSSGETAQQTKITITFPTNSYFISGLRDFTLNIIKNTTNFPEKWAFRFQSVVDELCNNAIEYGSAPGSEVRVTFVHTKDISLEIIVEDTGTGPKATSSQEITKIFQERRAPGYVFTGIRGRGLAKIVGEWTDEINFEDRPEGGLKISVKKYLKDVRQGPGIANHQNEDLTSTIPLSINNNQIPS